MTWFSIVLIAIINGTLQNLWYGKQFSELRAHQISTASGILLFGLYIWLLPSRWRPIAASQALAIGLLWLGLAVAFEFLFFHYAMGHPWRELLHDYNIFAGRIWVALLLWITIEPYVFDRMRQ